MKIVALTLVAIIIPLATFPAPTKANRGGHTGHTGGHTGHTGGHGAGGGGVAGGRGFVGGGTPTRGSGFKGGGEEPKGRDTSVGFMGGSTRGKRTGGGDTGPSIVVRPKPIEDPPPKVALPQECKPEVEHCVTTHVYGNGGDPPNGGECCTKLRYADPCMCRLLNANDPKVSGAANGVLRGCNYRGPDCRKPPTCRPDLKHCVQTHILGAPRDPQYGGECCLKFKYSKQCFCHYRKNHKLSRATDGILRGCRFHRPTCP